MSNVRTYTDKEILDRVKSLPSFKGWPKGVLDVWIRSNEDAYDQFDDKCYTFECYGDIKSPRFMMVCTGTTNAGQYGLKHFEEYNSVGCAVLKSDTLVYDSHKYGLHKGKQAFVQCKGFPYFRDANRNDHADEIGKEYNDIIGANCHRAGMNSTVIANWSVACLVRNNLTQFMAWLNFMDKKSLSVVILKEF